MDARGFMVFQDTDSVAHTVVFAKGLCSLTLTPGEAAGPQYVANGVPNPDCRNNSFPYFVGRYAYTVDGSSPGTVVTTALWRSVTLKARTRTALPGTRLTLHGQVRWQDDQGRPWYTAPFPVVVLARHDTKHPYEPIATLTAKVQEEDRTSHIGGWKLTVRPHVKTTYIAVAQQTPGRQVWTDARSRPLTIQIRH